MRPFILYLILLSVAPLAAQTVFQPKPLTDVSKGIIYEKEYTVDFTLNTNGYAFGVTWGKLANYYKTNFYHVSVGEIRHPKEFRQNFKEINTTTGQTSNSFAFGKQNNLIVIRGGKGFKRYYSEKAKEKGVAVALTIEGGPTIGLLKPYYMDVKKFNEGNRGQIVSIKYSEETAADFLNPGIIFGASGFAKGLDEIRFLPGLHGKIAANFEWGAYDEFIKAAEIGLMLDLFPRTVPIMVSDTNRAFFLNLYITLQLGRRS